MNSADSEGLVGENYIQKTSTDDVTEGEVIFGLFKLNERPPPQVKKSETSEAPAAEGPVTRTASRRDGGPPRDPEPRARTVPAERGPQAAGNRGRPLP
jgi:hypothetical protein